MIELTSMMPPSGGMTALLHNSLNRNRFKEKIMQQI